MSGAICGDSAPDVASLIRATVSYGLQPIRQTNRQNIIYRLEECRLLRHESVEPTSKGFHMHSNPSGHSITETASNKMFMQHICAELAKGNLRPFAEAIADDFCWIITGSSSRARDSL